jgi:hypothetical protein
MTSDSLKFRVIAYPVVSLQVDRNRDWFKVRGRVPLNMDCRN